MAEAGPREGQGPSLAPNHSTQNQAESSTAATQNTPEDQVRKHALLPGGLRLANHFRFYLLAEIYSGSFQVTKEKKLTYLKKLKYDHGMFAL